MKTNLFRITAFLFLVYAFFLPWPASMGQSGYDGGYSSNIFPDGFSALFRFNEYPLDGSVSIQWENMAITTLEVEEGVYISYGFMVGDNDLAFALINGTCLGIPDTREVICSYLIGSANMIVVYTPETPWLDIGFFVSQSDFFRTRPPELIGSLSLIEEY